MKSQTTVSMSLDATSLQAPPENWMVQDTLRWLERAVIGLNLCPFAKSVYVKGQVHCAVSSAVTLEALRDDLIQELKDLVSLDASVRDTSLLIVQNLLQDFYDYNDFLNVADDCLLALDLWAKFKSPVFIRTTNLQAPMKTTSPISPTDRLTPLCI